jgi:hypothetical protein
METGFRPIAVDPAFGEAIGNGPFASFAVGEGGQDVFSSR